MTGTLIFALEPLGPFKFESEPYTLAMAPIEIPESERKLIAWWKCDHMEGGKIDDSSDNNFSGTLVGNPKCTAGKTGEALEFDGVDDYVDCGNDAKFDITGQITLSAWVKTNDACKDKHVPYLIKGENTYGLKHHENNNIEFFIYNDTWYPVRFPVDSSFNGVWHHLAGTYDGTQLKLYVDGELKSTSDHFGPIGVSQSNVNIGRNSDMADRLYSGAIDDVRIYNYALSENDVAAIYAGKKLPTVVASGQQEPGRGGNWIPVLVIVVITAMVVALATRKKKVTT